MATAPELEIFLCYPRELTSEAGAFRNYIHEAGRQDLRVWQDIGIRAGDAWRQSIEGALGRVRAAVLMVDRHFFESRFIQEVELPYLVHRRAKDGVLLLPFFLDKLPEPEPLVSVPGSAAFRLSDLQGLNSPRQPLLQLPSREHDLHYRAARDRLVQAMETYASPGSQLVPSVPVPKAEPKVVAQGAPSPLLRLEVIPRADGTWEVRYQIDDRTLVVNRSGPELVRLRDRDSSVTHGELLGRLLLGANDADFVSLLRQANIPTTVTSPLQLTLRVQVVIRSPEVAAWPFERCSWAGRRLTDLGWSFEFVPATPVPVPRPWDDTNGEPWVLVLTPPDPEHKLAAHLDDLRNFVRGRQPHMSQRTLGSKAPRPSGDAFNLVYVYGELDWQVDSTSPAGGQTVFWSGSGNQRRASPLAGELNSLSGSARLVLLLNIQSPGVPLNMQSLGMIGSDLGGEADCVLHAAFRLSPGAGGANAITKKLAKDWPLPTLTALVEEGCSAHRLSKPDQALRYTCWLHREFKPWQKSDRRNFLQLVRLELDREDQRAHFARQLRYLLKRAPGMHVFVATGASGDRVDVLGQLLQADVEADGIAYLSSNTASASHRPPLDPADVALQVAQALRCKTSDTPWLVTYFQDDRRGQRRAAGSVPAACMLVQNLDLQSPAEGEGRSASTSELAARAADAWGRFLARQWSQAEAVLPKRPDLALVVLLQFLLPVSDLDAALPEIERALQSHLSDQWITLLRRLSPVQPKDVRRLLEFESARCDKSLHRRLAELIVAQTQGVYREVVRLLDHGHRTGWEQLLAELEPSSAMGLPAKPDHDPDDDIL